MNGTVTHVVGPAISYTDLQGQVHLRQRCAWCGASLFSIEVSTPDEIPMFATLSQVRVICGTVQLVDLPILGSETEESAIPEDSCLLIDPSITM